VDARAPTLLVIDDDPASCRLLAAIFEAQAVRVIAAHDAKAGLVRAEKDAPDVIVLDVHLPDRNGVELLDPLRSAHPDVPVIMLTAHGELRSAVRATKLGAFDYLSKPVEPEDITRVVLRALETRALKSEVEDLRRQLGQSGGLASSMGPSRQVETISEQVRVVAATDFSVLIVGETGTGKELVAQAIHRQSARRGSAFVAIDCGAIPETLLESELFGHEKGAFTGADRRKEGRFSVAQGGTVFLDEVGNLPQSLQAKLLRVLESRQLQAVGRKHATSLDVRFLAATNDDLQQRITQGRFRADLYFRLAQYTIALPPLRARVADIAHLSRRFLEEVSVELRRPVHTIAPEAIAALEKHAWPGNVRELRNLVRKAVLEAKELVLRKADFQASLRASKEQPPALAALAGASLKEIAASAAREAERQAIAEALRLTRGNKAQAARALKTDYKTLHLKLKALGIRARDFSA
jgi:two-component system nitrogen regulation response regulator GlnG